MTAPPPDLASTRVPIPGTDNVRDLGGYPVSGGVIARGRIYRSEALAQPGASEMHAIWDEAHADVYLALGVRTVVDLRSEDEMEMTPSAWHRATGAEVVELPIAEGGEGSDTNLMSRLMSGQQATFDADDLAAFYCDVVDRRGPEFGEALRLAADADRLPLLVHCSAGKDRTGLVTGILLDLLGADTELIVADYALTGVFRPNRVEAYAERLTAAGLDPEAVRVVFETPASAMAATLEHLHERWGGAEGYLLGPGGLSQDEIVALRRNLVSNQTPN